MLNSNSITMPRRFRHFLRQHENDLTAFAAATLLLSLLALQAMS